MTCTSKNESNNPTNQPKVNYENMNKEQLNGIAKQFLPSFYEGLDEIFSSRSLSKWHLKSTRADTIIYERNEDGIYGISSTVELGCTLREMKTILMCNSSQDFNKLMSCLLGTKFVGGNMISQDRRFENDVNGGLTCSETDEAAEYDGMDSPEQDNQFVDTSLKKAHFKGGVFNLLKTDAVFIDHSDSGRNDTSAVRMMKSVDDISASYHGKAHHQLHNILAGYYIDQLGHEANHNIRVTFYASHNYANGRLSYKTKRHLYSMAKSLRKLKEIVMQKRLGQQTFTLPKNVDSLKNIENLSANDYELMPCLSCDKKFSIVRLRHLCNICGLSVCGSCSDKYVIDVDGLDRLTKVRVCTPCINRVNLCEHDSIANSGVKTASVVETTDTNKNTFQFIKSLYLDAEPEEQEVYITLLHHLKGDFSTAELAVSPRASSRKSISLFDELLSSIEIDDVSTSKCVLNEQNQLRDYPLDYKWENPYPKCPVPKNDTKRIEKLRNLNVIDGPDVMVFDIITKAVAVLLGAPKSVICLIGEEELFLKSVYGFSKIEGLPRNFAICCYTITSNNPLLIQNAASDVRFCNNPIVTGDLKCKFYLGFPLVTSDGYALGTLAVLDNVPHVSITANQYAIFRVLAQTLTQLIERRVYT